MIGTNLFLKSLNRVQIPASPVAEKGTIKLEWQSFILSFCQSSLCNSIYEKSPRKITKYSIVMNRYHFVHIAFIYKKKKEYTIELSGKHEIIEFTELIRKIKKMQCPGSAPAPSHQ